jgi:hypothetical protein
MLMKPKGIGKLTAVTINGRTIFVMLRQSNDGRYRLTDSELLALSIAAGFKHGDCIICG